MTMESVARSYAMNSQRFNFQAAKHVIASQRVGANARPMTGSAKQWRGAKKDWIASLRSQ
jgi:hypothetical protein